MSRSFARGPAVACALALAALQLCGRAQADEYPTRPVTIIVSLAPGTGMDTAVRLYGEKLAQRLGQPVVIENRPGGAGVVAGETIAKGTPDGYTLAVATSAVMAIRPTLFKQRPFDPLTDFVPISHYVKSPFVFIVNPSLPVRSVPEFIAYAKERPGKLNYASVGPGGLQHLGIALLAQRAAIDIVHIPYNSTMAVSALMSGDVELYLGTSGEMMNAGTDKVKRLAIGSTKRIPQLPDLPTIAETLPGFRVAGWNGMFAPAGTPPEIVNVLAKEISDLAREPAMAQKLTELGIEPVGNTPAEFADVIRVEHASYREALKTAGLLKE